MTSHSATLRLVSLLLLPVLLAMQGCGAPAPDPAPMSTLDSTHEATWTDQIAAVREGASREVVVTETPVAEEELEMLGKGCESLEVLDIGTLKSPSVADDLTVLQALPHLRRVRFGFEVDDAMLETLAATESLRAINLPKGTFSDAGLAKLAELPELELLRFHSPHVTDAGMQSIAAMPSLRFLHLIDVPITDDGIAALHEMDQLESLYIDGGACTDDGLRALLQALPELHFHRDQLHLPDDPHRHPHD
ncbi:hypothetical protein Mal4_37070 [Maioricimonas rarisocia]|uniref:Leucine Rich repeats (2 copies) n=1 Tax=Maioricimonas rarisocia TaxID=2528026 RepID=A0A517ZA46_9PLAN|nr:hypothetical protein [Maioricimonas rarisocia]QDU39365.1 hypothetical protein Mal4_37070 [Maioricimonas rarisocia]